MLYCQVIKGNGQEILGLGFVLFDTYQPRLPQLIRSRIIQLHGFKSYHRDLRNAFDFPQVSNILMTDGYLSND